MNDKTFSYCFKCSSINKISLEKLKAKAPICGACQSTIKMHGLVSEVDFVGISKMIQKSDLPVVIDFWAPWCGPCKSFAPTYETASQFFAGKIVFIKINTQDFPQASEQFNIRGIPTLLVFKNGKEIARESGAFPLEHFKNWLGGYV